MTFRCVVWQAIGYYVPLPFWLTVMVLQTLSIGLVIRTMRSSGGDFSDVALRVCSYVVVVTLVLLISPGVALVLYWVVVPSTRPASNDAFTQPAILAGRAGVAGRGGRALPS